MSSSSSAQYSSSENACRTSLEPIKQVRPKLQLLKILQAAGAQGETFTLKEIIHYLGEYIMLKQLYDKEQQHMVYCGGDQLGDLLGRESFSVKDPSPIYDMLKRNVTSATVADAAQTLALAKDQSVDNPSQDQLKQSSTERSFGTGQVGDEGDTSTLSTSKYASNEDEDIILLDNLSKEQATLDLVLEEWDVAGLPWWFLGNLRNNYKSRSNGSTDIHTNQDVDTAIVSDTTDDLWFLNEAASDQLEVTVPTKTFDCEQANEDEKEYSKMANEFASSDDFEDSQCLSDDTDVDTPTEDCWQCTKCKMFNSPIKRYCFRCWALRKDWFSDCPKLAHSLSTSNIATMQNKEDTEGMDVPDCRRTVSAPIVRPKDLCGAEVKSSLSPKSTMNSLDLAQGCEGREPSLQFGKCKEKEEVVQSLESSKQLLKPCLMCQKKPRNGNIVHGKTAHLVACFTCAKMLKKGRLPCPVCKKQIQMVIRTFIA
ncbi:protein Mdm4 isoform X1 [Varanus komodoensis]|uniref:protein Mdm4 isoform X1 n=1 Tax=Varanus komodoensis TaxID=61221 RepID=UPI001CF7A6E8|nr:protein Mdm4 isoform X1 [Varanus komodoensis]XP_044301604.1 protein Mdm4 isoform X1 [Varanus komodoensis]XP_044301614.1 protein Mdm4 isoform X1 [Varanus komodoensis]XP_044301623.1 protein Mdm4 isoform X1 [Varanus komodoensis]